MININHLSITFDRVIFDDASITLSNNSITMIKGKSGTGKTTLLNQLGLVAPLACDYLMEGHSIDDPLTTRKEKIGYVHQESTLFNNMTIKENMEFAFLLSGQEYNETRMNDILCSMKIEHLLNQTPDHVSGGERQRAAIAFALMKDPYLLLLDEPTASLDSINCKLLIELLSDYIHTHPVCALIATHDKRILDYADDLYEIQNHKIVRITKSSIEELETTSITRKPQNYLSYYKKHLIRSSKILYILFGLILSMTIGILGYRTYYSHQINAIQEKLLDVRLYYGNNSKYAYDSITQPIRMDIRRDLNEIEHIHITPFYETVTDDVIVQSYTGDTIKASRTIKNLGKDITINNHTFHISSYINKKNTISSQGDDVLYLPETLYRKYFEIDDVKMLLVSVDDAQYISSILSQINDIDPHLTVYSNVNLDHLTQINSRMMNSLMMLICAIFIIMLIILIYHRQKTIDSNKDEYFFLYENGLSIKELKSLARYDYVYYYVFYLIILLIISIFMTFMMHIPIILYACLLWFFSILLEEFITTLCIHKVGRLDQPNYNKWSTKLE